MARGQRVAVVGAGIAGASVAFHLAAAGADVVLVDDRRAGRATAAGAGIVARPWRDRGSPAFDLRSRAVAAYPALAARVGAAFDVVGELYVAPPGPALDEAHEALVAAGAAPERLEPGEAQAAFPYLAAGLAAVGVAGTARVEGERIRVAMVGAAVAAGAEVVDGAAELEADGAGVAAVHVAGRRLGAGAVVVAAGAWSAELVAPLGLSLPLAPQRGQIVHLGVADDTAGWPVVQPIGGDHYLLAFPDRRVVVGATRETGAGFAPRLTAGGVAKVLADALVVAPGLAGAEVRELRVGLRPASADGDPLLGAVPGCPGLWIATGMGPQGLTLGPYCGKLVAGAVLDEPAEVDLAPFAPLRASA